MGTTIMQMDAGLDTGPVIESVVLEVTSDDDAGSVLQKMAEVSGPALVRALDAVEAGTLVAVPQPAEGSSVAAKITDADRLIDPSRPARELVGQVRALSPHIGAVLHIDGQPFKVWRTREWEAPAPAGLTADSGALLLGTATNGLQILDIQPPGKGRMPIDAFLRGYRGELDLTSP